MWRNPKLKRGQSLIIKGVNSHSKRFCMWTWYRQISASVTTEQPHHEDFSFTAMKTLQKPSTTQHPSSYPMPCHWLFSDLFVPLPPRPLPPDGSVSINKHHGRSDSRAQQARILSADVEKRPSGKRSFVSFQIYLGVFKAGRCCVYPVVYHPSCSSPELLLWEMPLVWDLTAGGMSSHCAFL